MIALPASLFAAGMVLYAATFHADSYVSGVPMQNWLLTSLILVASLLLARSMYAQQHVDYGYDNEAVMTARMGLMDGEYPNAEARRVEIILIK